MKKSAIFLLGFIFMVLIAISFCGNALAQGAGGTTANPGITGSTVNPGLGGTTNPPGITGMTGGTSIPNPIGTDTIQGLIAKIVGYIMAIAVPITTIMILWGAFEILTSRGDAAQLKNGRKTIIYALAGFAVVLVATGIPYLVANLLGGG